MAGAKRIEFVRIAILKRYWPLRTPDCEVIDVHSDPSYFPRGIDLILKSPNQSSLVSADVKVDTYIGSDPARKVRGLCNPDSGVLLVETLSQLQYDRHDRAVRGWLYTNQGSEMHY